MQDGGILTSTKIFESSSWRTLFSGTLGTLFNNFLIDLDLTWIDLYYLEETYISEKNDWKLNEYEDSLQFRSIFIWNPCIFQSKFTYKSNDKSTFLENIVK